MKTAMQELIELLKIEENSISDNDSHEDRCWRNGVRCSIKKAIELLEKEKEQIINACNSAFEDKTTWGERYYNQTYNQEPKKEYQPSEEYLKKQRDNMEDFVWNKMNKNNQKNGI